MKKGTKVTVRMSKGPSREGKYVGREESRGEWFVIQPPEKGAATFKARPSQVTEVK
jgi:hypothetical protein